MTNRQAAVWIDHHEAKIFHVEDGHFDLSKIDAPQHHFHRHPKGPSEGREHPADARHFFHEVAQALQGAEEILVVGPATAKLELIKHIHAREPLLESKVVGVETVDHPTDGQLAAYVKRYFLPASRTHRFGG
jgi:stalled ribosome rescue protein Dom34